MQANIVHIKETILVGMKRTMSISKDTTRDLFSKFMPRRTELLHKNTENIFCVQVYPTNYFDAYNPVAEFEKWAGVEVTKIIDIPIGMEKLIIPAGQYALFIHKGPASECYATMENIFRQWLPGSLYELDNRPHFEIMGEKYKHESPDTEEEIFIPVKLKLNAAYN
jgi:AraC family transcriptional regulator